MGQRPLGGSCSSLLHNKLLNSRLQITNMKKTISVRLSRVLVTALMVSLIAIGGFMPTNRAAAATIPEMQAQIQLLLAQITQLQMKLAAMQGQSTVCPYTWNRTLTIGSTGPDVKKLQQFLNSSPDTQLANSGIGSKGQETEYYGPMTGAAVIKLKNKYSSELLTPYGLTTADMYFGGATLAKVNSLCKPVQTPTTPSTPSTPSTPNNQVEERGNEAILSHFKTSSGDDTNLEEGQKNVQVMEVEADIKDSDITITRVDIAVEHVSGDEDDPWDTFKEVSLYVDGKKVAHKDADSKSDWSENSPYNDAYRIRLSGLSLDFDESEDLNLSVAVTLQNGIKGSDDGLSWNVFIPDNGIRFSDDSRTYQEIGDNDEVVNIDIMREGGNDELSIKTSKDDPDSTTLEVRDDRSSDWLTVFAFDLDTGDSTNDIELNKLPISLTVSSGNVSTYLHDVRLVVDGQTYDDVTITDGTTNTMLFDFDSGDLVIDAGDRVTAELEVKFKSLALANEGVTIFGSVDGDNIEAEGADDLTDSQLSGASTGDEHTLRTFGLTSEDKGSSADTVGQTDPYGEYAIKFDLTAFNGDFYLTKAATTTTSTSTGGVMYTVDGTTPFTGTVSTVLSSSAKENNGNFILREGQTETFTLAVVINPDTAGQYRIKLNKVYFSANTDGVTDVGTLELSPATDYRTSYKFINN